MKGDTVTFFYPDRPMLVVEGVIDWKTEDNNYVWLRQSGGASTRVAPGWSHAVSQPPKEKKV